MCMRGWARNEVSTLNSSCEWCSEWMRHTTPTRWSPQCASQLHRSMATSVTTTTTQRGQPAVQVACSQRAWPPRITAEPTESSVMKGAMART